MWSTIRGSRWLVIPAKWHLTEMGLKRTSTKSSRLMLSSQTQLRGVAKRGEFAEGFGTQNTLSICNQIILNGRVHLSELERTVEQERKFTEIASIVALRLTNPATGAAYPRTLIEFAMKNDLHYRVTQQPASAQAAHVIRQLEEFMGVHLPQKVNISVELPLSHAKACIAVCVTDYALTIDPESFILDEQSCFYTATVGAQQYKFVCKSLKELSTGLAHISLKGTSSFKTK